MPSREPRIARAIAERLFRSSIDEPKTVVTAKDAAPAGKWRPELAPAFMESIALVKRAFREPIGSSARAELILESFEVVMPRLN